jgi:hypothetical protein
MDLIFTSRYRTSNSRQTHQSLHHGKNEPIINNWSFQEPVSGTGIQPKLTKPTPIISGTRRTSAAKEKTRQNQRIPDQEPPVATQPKSDQIPSVCGTFSRNPAGTRQANQHSASPTKYHPRSNQEHVSPPELDQSSIKSLLFVPDSPRTPARTHQANTR